MATKLVGRAMGKYKATTSTKGAKLYNGAATQAMHAGKNAFQQHMAGLAAVRRSGLAAMSHSS